MKEYICRGDGSCMRECVLRSPEDSLKEPDFCPIDCAECTWVEVPQQITAE